MFACCTNVSTGDSSESVLRPELLKSIASSPTLFRKGASVSPKAGKVDDRKFSIDDPDLRKSREYVLINHTDRKRSTKIIQSKELAKKVLDKHDDEAVGQAKLKVVEKLVKKDTVQLKFTQAELNVGFCTRSGGTHG